MAFDIYQQERIDRILTDNNVEFYSKKMMGGLCYMSNGKMLCGLLKDHLMARIGIDAYKEALKREYVKEMSFTGRAMKGYVFVEEAGMDLDDDLEYWVMKCVAFNPLAKSSKKKKKK